MWKKCPAPPEFIAMETLLANMSSAGCAIVRAAHGPSCAFISWRSMLLFHPWFGSPIDLALVQISVRIKYGILLDLYGKLIPYLIRSLYLEAVHTISHTS